MIKSTALRSKNQGGFSLIEMLVAAGILTVIMLAAATFFTNQLRSNNFLEFQSKREQLHLTLMGQVLRTPDNCRCMFKNSGTIPMDPPSGGHDLAGYTPPTEIAKYLGANCTNPEPVITADGMDSMKLISVGLEDITKQPSGIFGGKFVATIESTKDVLGPKQLRVSVPVNVLTLPDSATSVKFDGCTTSGDFTLPTATTPPPPGTPLGNGTVFTTTCRHGSSCDDQAKIICNEYMNGAPHCLKDLYSSIVDGGGKNAGIEGYVCSIGLCPNGTETYFTQPYRGEP